MAHWFDYLVLAGTLGIIAAFAYVFLAARNALPGAVESAKGSLKGKGVDVSQNGLSVKTDKKLDREQYLDATQRGFIKAFNASSGGNRPLPESANETPRGKRRFRRRA